MLTNVRSKNDVVALSSRNENLLFGCRLGYQDLHRLVTALLWLGCFFSTWNVTKGAELSRKLVVKQRLEFVVSTSTSEELLDHLAQAYEQLEQRLMEDLGIPRLEVPARVYLFQEQSHFEQYVTKHIPSVEHHDVQVRHGIFLLRQGNPYVFLMISADLDACFLHEMTHVLLNAQHPGMPLWLDEGLAQCYAEPKERDHWNTNAANTLFEDWLRRAPPSLDRLQVLDTLAALDRRDYAGCWAHTYHLLQHQASGRQVLRAYLDSLRINQSPATLKVEPVSRAMLKQWQRH